MSYHGLGQEVSYRPAQYTATQASVTPTSYRAAPYTSATVSSTPAVAPAAPLLLAAPTQPRLPTASKAPSTASPPSDEPSVEESVFVEEDDVEPYRSPFVIDDTEQLVTQASMPLGTEKKIPWLWVGAGVVGIGIVGYLLLRR